MLYCDFLFLERYNSFYFRLADLARLNNNYYLFLEHDAHNPIITVKHTDKGVRLDECFTINEFFN